MKTKREMRDFAMERARYFAKAGIDRKVKLWVIRAKSYHAVSDIQFWTLKNITGPARFRRLNLMEYDLF